MIVDFNNKYLRFSTSHHKEYDYASIERNIKRYYAFKEDNSNCRAAKNIIDTPIFKAAVFNPSQNSVSNLWSVYCYMQSLNLVEAPKLNRTQFKKALLNGGYIVYKDLNAKGEPRGTQRVSVPLKVKEKGLVYITKEED